MLDCQVLIEKLALTRQINSWKSVTISSTEKKSCKNQKKDTLKKKLLSIIYKTKKQQKKSQKIVTKTCQKKKKTRLKSIKDKGTSNWFSTKMKRYKINEFCFYSL